MITSRIATALRKQDWVVVLIELSLVFAGVLIALQFDNWNTVNRNQRELNDMLERLEAELDLNATVIAGVDERVSRHQDERNLAVSAIENCEDSVTARENLNTTLNDLTGDFSPSLSANTLEQLNRRDQFLDLLTPEFRNALGVYTNQIQEERVQLHFNAGLRWDQHVMKHPFVSANLTDLSQGIQLSPQVSLLEVCSDASFKRQLFATAIFVESTRLRVNRFGTYMDTFRAELESEIQRRSL
ncbi:MAG: hypothetical protein AAGH90_05150 [Pseudomonadota bacterium]